MRQSELPRAIALLRKIADRYDPPLAEAEQRHRDPFRTTVGVLASSRTKDNTTGPAMERLFTQASTPAQMAALSEKRIASLIYPVGFYRAKARYIRALSQMLVKDFAGEVPNSMDGLLSLPGIGRKSANLILGVAFGKPAICVDTHVHRITNRWGYVATKNPYETEMVLREKLPGKYWIEINRLLVVYGQNLCTPQSPWCSRCSIEKYCDKTGVKRSR